jgi:hypothetical protein
LLCKENKVAGNKTGITPAFLSALIPVSLAEPKWSADIHFSSAASSAPPMGSISSQCIFNLSPCSPAQVSIWRDSSILKVCASVKISQNSAIPCSATAGIISLQRSST